MPRLGGAGPKPHKKLSLTLLLIALVTLVVLLTSTILLTASYQSKKKSLIETTLNLNLSNAERMSRTVDSLFRSMRSSMVFSADKLSRLYEAQPEEVNDYLEVMRKSSTYFNSILLVGANGIIRNTSPVSLEMAGKPVESPWAAEALRLRGPYLSEPFTAPLTGRMIVFMSEPLYDGDKQYLGLLGGTVYLQNNNILNMIFGSSNDIDATGSYYYIVSSDGHLLFHPDKERINEDIGSNEVVQELMKGNSGQREAVNIKGIQMLAGYSSVPANGWGVVVVSPVSVIQKELWSQIRTTLAYTLIPFILLLLLAGLLAHQLAKPFVLLADLMNRVGKEKAELPVLEPHWNREADLLTKAVAIAWSDIQKQTDQLTQEAMTDVLTALPNRRSLEITMNQWIAAQVSFSVIVLDVDKFKFVNDTYGHLAGDEVLKQVAGILRASIRPGDVCCRYGGEEFVVLLPRTKAADAYAVAERIRIMLEASDAPLAMQVTSSQGIAHYPTHGNSLAELLEQADRAMYSAKDMGRNRTIIASE
ncbi:sensor domain-containing diguanylate cyclase [Paenibacillus sp. S150]|uniref:sensor domain-containing diguanylate cyclase n=1 Tax=Paenibacillus sp. S150 TaxID=2749826 RepID=UPI001C57BC3F|nr:sensor domain-containing diguanylate cyclase [Paenibacillus sp. S150]MBW4083114.1 GGDEF domain-containing protein [Paenibacillus sp. S150]